MKIDFNKGMPRFSAALGPPGAGPPGSGPPGNGPLSVDQFIALITATQHDVANAKEKGLFVPLPAREPQQSKDRSRIKTIRNRLFILGYLKKDTGRGNLDPSLTAAIEAFQEEAGLDVDGWVGEQETWPALQELVSFETPIELQKWFAGGKAMSALRRAVALRLHVIGLLPRQPRSPDEDIQEALKSFGRIWKILFGDAPQTEPSLSQEWLALLFDMDGITRRLSKIHGPLSGEAMDLGHSFLINTAKIELWLMGYRVRPGGYDIVEQRSPKSSTSAALTGIDIWKRSATVTQHNKIKRNLLFYKALHRFWIDHGFDDAVADDKSVGFLMHFQSFFQIADEGIQTGSTLDTEQQQIDLEVFVKERKEHLPSIWDNVNSFGARIWDGVRRVWGWFRRMLTKVKKKVLEIGSNLSRLIYDFALGSFGVISNVFRSLTSMVHWVVKPMLPGTDKKNIAFCRDFDSDIYVAVAEDADSRMVSDCCEKLAHAGRMFAFGCQVIGTFTSILISVWNSAWFGFYGLVLALIKIRRFKYKIQELTQAYRQVFSI